LRPSFAPTLLAAALALSGCRGIRPSARPAPSPQAAVSPSGLRAGVVDLNKVARVHPRWKELEALAKRLQRVQGQLAAPALPPFLSDERLRRQLEAQGKALQAEFQAEIQVIRERQEAKLRQFADEVRGRQETLFEQRKAQVEAQLRKALDDRARALQEELRRYELQVMEEYRYPLANLRLKADVVGVASEDELKRMTEEIERLQDERDAKVRARAQAIDATMNDFQRAKALEAEARLVALKKTAEAEIRRQAEAKRRELEAENAKLVREKEQEFNRRLADVRLKVLGVAGDQVKQAQGRYAEGLRKREQQLLAEERAVNEQRLRLEDSILAEVKIEAAAIAAQRGLDVVLTRYTLNMKMEDLTQAVIARLKR